MNKLRHCVADALIVITIMAGMMLLGIDDGYWLLAWQVAGGALGIIAVAAKWEVMNTLDHRRFLRDYRAKY